MVGGGIGGTASHGWIVGLTVRWDCYDVLLVGGGIGGRCILNMRETPATHPLV